VSKKTAARYFCPISVTLAVIGGKWKPLILYSLKGGPRRFNAIQAKLPHVSHKVLTQHLKELQAAGLITCSRTANTSTYRLTELAQSLKPALTALAAWGVKHHGDLNVRLVWPPTPGGRDS
jgi:DNA-binding HxlR family transcriptional regulator